MTITPFHESTVYRIFYACAIIMYLVHFIFYIATVVITNKYEITDNICNTFITIKMWMYIYNIFSMVFLTKMMYTLTLAMLKRIEMARQCCKIDFVLLINHIVWVIIGIVCLSKCSNNDSLVVRLSEMIICETLLLYCFGMLIFVSNCIKHCHLYETNAPNPSNRSHPPNASNDPILYQWV